MKTTTRNRSVSGVNYNILLLDQKISSAVYELGSCIPRRCYKFLEVMGDGLIWLMLATVALLSPTVSPLNRHAWATLMIGLLLDLILVGLLKVLIRRSRPEHNMIHKDMTVIVKVDHFSFPSGHTSRASMVATLACVIFRQTAMLLCATAVCWAVLTGASRAFMGRHYVGDVVAGFFLGLATTGLLTQGTYAMEGAVISSEIVNDVYGKFLQRLTGLF